jgi:hypothetical protein
MIDDLSTCALFYVAVSTAMNVWIFIMNWKGYGRKWTWLNLARGSVFGWDNMLQSGRSRVRVPMRSLTLSVDLILPAVLWRWDEAYKRILFHSRSLATAASPALSKHATIWNVKVHSVSRIQRFSSGQYSNHWTFTSGSSLSVSLQQEFSPVCV